MWAFLGEWPSIDTGVRRMWVLLSRNEPEVGTKRHQPTQEKL